MSWFNKYTPDSILYDASPDMVDERDAVNGIQVTYCGFCDEGTKTTADKKWRIIRYVAILDAGATVTEKMYADGSTLFNYSWDDRESYNYQFRQA